MHELSIAQAVVDVVTRHAGGRRVHAVEVRVGHLRQVVPDSLEFAFGLIVSGTPLDGAELRIEEVPAAGVCRCCGARTQFEDFPFACGECGSLDMELVEGEELLVDALELDEELVTSGRTGDGD
jgi:hydrogenase nickel incorporation protein HypA/HybF